MLGELQPWFSGRWFDHFRKDADELFDRFFGGGYRSPMIAMTLLPAVESFFKDGNWVIRVDLPGVDPKDIEVSVVGDTLTVRASRERRGEEHNHNFELREVAYGRIERSVTLPEGVKGDQIRASYHNGVLELTMPAPELAGRKIPVEIDAQERRQLETQAHNNA